MGIMQLYRPEVFQGHSKKTGYFEGWYFKHVSADFRQVLAVIPGISLAGEPHSFVQVIDGTTGETHYIDYPAGSFQASRRRLDIRIGDNHFTPDGCRLSVHRDGLDIEGILGYRDPVGWPRRLLAPGIMGWYSFVPFMECYHGVVSLDHRISGTLQYQGAQIDFMNGRGYIEKDWGTSMPESWIWLHANTFPQEGSSVMLSVAKIPWRGSFFIGFLAWLLHRGKLYRFMTYNRSKVVSIGLNDNKLHIHLSNRKFNLLVEATQNRAGKLKAPVHGLMERYIKESIDSEVGVTLSDSSGRILFEGAAPQAGMEVVGNPSELMKIGEPTGQ